MAYVAARGGEEAIQASESLHYLLRERLSSEAIETIQKSLPYLLDRIMGEGSLYSPELAALALTQTGGDLYEAILLLRAYRSTQPRLAYAEPISQEDILVIRRISAAFKDIPGGQILGPSLDYSHRVLKMEILDDSATDTQIDVREAETPTPNNQPALAAWQRDNGLLAQLAEQAAPDSLADLPDITREPLLFPASRSHRLQSLARADTGGVLSLAYSDMRGYGSNHPTVNEVRLGYADIAIQHPLTGEVFSAGRIRVSQAEVVSSFGGSTEEPQLNIGFAATMGWNEVKTIAASMLDMAMDKPDPFPALSEEFVLMHTEPVESSGFCIHYKLPHYVTFQSSLEAMRKVKDTAHKTSTTADSASSEKASTEDISENTSAKTIVESEDNA